MAIRSISGKKVPPKPATQGAGSGAAQGGLGAAGAGTSRPDPKQAKVEQTGQGVKASLGRDRVTTQKPRTQSSDKLQAFAAAGVSSGEHPSPTRPQVARGLGTGASGEVQGEMGAGGSSPHANLDVGRQMQSYISTGHEETDQRRNPTPELTPGDARREQQLGSEIANRELATQNDEIVQRIDGLQVGEKITDSSSMGGSAKVPGVKIAEAGIESGQSTSVERTGESEFKVTQSGDLGGHVGVGVDVKGVGVGGDSSLSGERKDAYMFSSAADAKRGADILRNGPRNSSDSKFLEDHRASTEFGVKVGTSAGASFPSPGKVVVGTNVSVKQEAATSIKYNYKRNADGTVARDAGGKPVVDSMEFITKTSGSFTGKGKVSVPPAVSVDTGNLTKGEIEIEQKTVVKVPSGVNPDDVARDPSLGQQLNQNSAETTVKVSGESRIAGMQEGESRIHEIETKVRTVQAEGQPQKPRVETTSRVYEKRGHVYTGGLDIGPVGGTYSHETSKTSKPVETKNDTLSSS